MDVQTDSERVRHSRKMVMEFLGSSVDLSTAPAAAGLHRALRRRPGPLRRRRPRRPRAGERDAHEAGHHHPPPVDAAQTVAQPVKVDNDLYVRDYSKCILCYKCVEACGEDAQNTFAIAVAGRGFDARISTEAAVPLPDIGLRLLRQLHRRLPDRRADVQVRVRHARRRDVGRERPDRDRDDLPVLRRRLRSGAPRPGQHDRHGDLAARLVGHRRPSLRQGPIRLPVRPEPRTAPGTVTRR